MTLLLVIATVSDTGTCVPLSNQAVAWQKNLGFPGHWLRARLSGPDNSNESDGCSS